MRSVWRGLCCCIITTQQVVAKIHAIIMYSFWSSLVSLVCASVGTIFAGESTMVLNLQDNVIDNVVWFVPNCSV